MRRAWLTGVLCALVALSLSAQEAPLAIVKAGPEGEISSLAQANEIRITFSEPMVVLGKIPKNYTPSFFKITPAVSGTFRWSGTTTLIFTPDPKKKLPFATKFTVTIDASAATPAGKKLGKPFSFSFTTPTLRLLNTNWYRKGDNPDAPIIFGLRFNQPIDPAAVAAHLRFELVPHEERTPELQENVRPFLLKLDANAEADFNAKVASIEKAASASGNLLGYLATEWNEEMFAKGNDLLVFESRPGVQPGSQVRIRLGENAPAKQGKELPGMPQEFTVETANPFFVTTVDCAAECNPENYNGIHLTQSVDIDDVRRAITLYDITDPASHRKVKQTTAPDEESEEGEEYDPSSFTLEDAGYSITPNRKYLVTLDKTLRSTDGQPLGYLWGAVIDYWHKGAFSSFGDGHGVWESSGGPSIPFSARNLTTVDQWVTPLTVHELMPTIIRNQEASFRTSPSTPPTKRKLAPKPDKIQSYGVDISKVLGPGGTGLFWATIQDGEPIARAHRWEENIPKSTIVQVTNLGLSVKDSPQNTLIFVTRLDNAQPVAGANVAIRKTDNTVFWSGVTDARGIAVAPRTPLRENDWTFAFIVTAEKDGDFAYVGSNWNEGISPWEFGLWFDLDQRRPILRGTVFSDRGVYKLGEEIHFKAILRSDTPEGMKLFPKGTKVKLTLKDVEDNDVDTRTLTLNEWSSADWVFKLPADSPLGDYRAIASIEGQNEEVVGSFLVAAYRRPDFRVDATLSGGNQPIAGISLNGTINGRYLFGAPMATRPVQWTYSKRRVWDVPDAITDRYPWERYVFLGSIWEVYERESDDETVDSPRVVIEQKEAKLDKNGQINLSLKTDLTAGEPFAYELEGEVTDVSRQKIAGRASVLVHPAPWYIGFKRPPYFAEASQGINTDILAVTPDGKSVAGVKVKVELKQIQWHSVRRAEGNGFYTWESERKDIPAGEWTVTTAESPVPLSIPLRNGGYFVMRAIAKDEAGRSTSTSTSFYASGAGYTAWERYDHNRIDLVPEKKSWKPGDTARIMIKSPWEKATALLTTEREGVRTNKTFELTSTQQTIEIPITEADIPNVFVSVLLVKGRTQEPTVEDTSDPGKPAFRLGYTELKVEDISKKLQVSVRASREEYRPGAKAKIDVAVKDQKGKAAPSEVTLWAVDYGVLSLTGYQAPEVFKSVWMDKALQVVNSDSRQRIISRRVLTPKGAEEGGGGGMDAVRKDFRVLAFWLGSVTTNSKGEASTEVTLPESLTTYRIMAVAGDKQSRFGAGSREIRTNKPLLLKPAFPRFMTIGDRATFGSVVHNQLPKNGEATVMIKSLDPDLLTVTGETARKLPLGPSAAEEIRFELHAKAAGNARLQMSVKMGNDTDAFEDIIPIRFVTSPEVVAAYGVANPEARETVKLPAGVVTTYGGLHLGLSSTALVNLSEGAKYLVEYPYGCAEQRASATLALMLAEDLGDAFEIPGLVGKDLAPTVQTNLRLLQAFQCPSGGFAFWKGECHSVSPYLTSYVVHVLQKGKALEYSVSEDVLANAYSYLEEVLNGPKPLNESWWPSHSAWQAFAVKVLAEGGRNADSHINRLFDRLDRMPLFGIAYLHDALLAAHPQDKRLVDLRRRMTNAILTEAGASHVEELNDPYLLYLWSSNVRSTGIVLDSLVRAGHEPTLIRSMVRWMLDVRKNGRWSNTQENAIAMEALVDYYRKYEAEVPDFTATASLGAQPVVTETFRGRDTKEKASDIPMQQLLQKAPAGTELPLVFRRDGKGTLFYTARLAYASTDAVLEGMNQGFAIERVYTSLNQKAGTASMTEFKAGDTYRVTLTLHLTKERIFVAVTDPLPAGFEPVETAFATTSTAATEEAQRQEGDGDTWDWMRWWREGGFDRVERHDDKVNLFATRLGAGTHTYSYTVRATTSGTFRAAPARAEEMYRPEVWGRTGSVEVKVQ